MSLRCGGSLCKVQGDKRLLPLIGEGWDEVFPAKALFFIVILNSGAKRNVIQNPLQPPLTRHTGLDPVSPSSSDGFKIISTLAIRPTMRL